MFFGIHGLVDEAFLASDNLTEYYLVKRLDAGGYVSRGPFINVDEGTLYAFGRGSWRKRGTDYIGIRFDNGAGMQYGWIRIRLYGQNQNFAFRVLDYAYADPGEPIKTGQRSSGEPGPHEGSLGWLALGAAGVALWRQGKEFPERSLSGA